MMKTYITVLTPRLQIQLTHAALDMIVSAFCYVALNTNVTDDNQVSIFCICLHMPVEKQQ